MPLRCVPSTRHGRGGLARAAALLLIAGSAGPVHGAVYSVGTAAGCTHATLQEAINAAVANGADPTNLVKLTTGTVAVPNGVFVHNPATTIVINGGYTSCTGAPGDGTRTVLDATGGANGTVIDVRNFATATPRTVRFGRLDITGGTGETGIGASSEGGGLELRGSLRVELQQQTRIQGNTAFRAAGVLMQGGPGRVVLSVEEGSRIGDNIADQDGGGVWCFNLGTVILRSGTVDFNRAGRDGGGIWLGDQCVLEAGAPHSLAGESVLLGSNAAGVVEAGRGGAVYFASAAAPAATPDVSIVGRPDNPILLTNNSTARRGVFLPEGSGGGMLFAGGRGSARHRVVLRDTVMVGNLADSAGSAVAIDRAIDLEIAGSAARCSGGLFDFQLCSFIGAGDQSAVYVRGFASADGVSPQVRILRTRFSQNAGMAVIESDTSGAATATLRIDSSVFDANTTRMLVRSTGSYAFRYSTAVGNPLQNAFGLIGLSPPGSSSAVVDLSGSILWQPGTLVFSAGGTGTARATHNGCLLAHETTGIDGAASVIRSAPMLGADFTPGPSSPALDVCNEFFLTPAIDAFGLARPQDQPGIANLFGAHDLGAIERAEPLADALFADSFE